MSSLKNDELHEAALELDAKMLALPESSTDANARSDAAFRREPNRRVPIRWHGLIA
jgi:hypothetical protein